MSEHTPDTSNGLADGAEPSMEDILASIRKIIADDEDNAPDKALKDDVQPLGEPQTAALDINDVPDRMDLDIVADTAPSDEEIDLLIADMDAIDTDPLKTSSVDDILELGTDDIMELEIPAEQDTPEAALESVVPDLKDEPVAKAAESVPGPDLDNETQAFDDDLSAMLDDMMKDDVAELDADIAHDVENLDLVVDPAEDLISESDDLADLEPETFETESDMELVKSLMADLTGEPLHDDTEMDEDELAEIPGDVLDGTAFEDVSSEDVPEAETADLLTQDLLDDVETPDDVMDEILSLTLDDEMELQAEDLAASGIEESLSLKDIAAQAEADADMIDGGKAKTLAAGVVAAAGAAALLDDAQEDHDALATDDNLAELNEADDVDDVLSQLDELVDTAPEVPSDTISEATAEPIIEDPTDLPTDEETTPMPRAAKKDAIIDEVTETATADVFSTLNKAVEEKAVIAERGDRIGDLVQEALRPMLKEWLDENLKSIVERAVTKEVKRISSGK